MPRIASSGWTVRVTHPQTDRTVQPDVLDEPAILPSLNSLPEVRVPVRKSDLWLDPGFNSDPTMDVWLDGEKQPIDILEQVEERQDRTILVGVGATELRNRAAAEFRSERRHDAADSIIQNHTTYNRDIDTPVVDSKDGVDFQDPTLTNEFDADLDYSDTDPVDTSGDEVTIHQTNFIREGEDVTTSSGTTANFQANFSGTSPENGIGESEEFTGDNESATYDFTLDYDIPADDFELWLRFEFGSSDATGDPPDMQATINGDTWTIVTTGDLSLEWRDVANNPTTSDSYSGGDLTAGNYTLTLETINSGGTSPFIRVDVVAPLDAVTRFTGGSDATAAYTFDDTVTEGSDGGNYLDGPGLHPEVGVEVMGEDEISAFSITDGDATLSIDDTTGDQYLQLSNDRGNNWLPTGGSQNNTASVDVSFASPSSTIRLRFNLDAFSPNGTRNQTPRENYDAQTVTDYDLNGDIDFELLLTDYSQDQSVIDHLNEIATTKFIWSANLDSSGNYQVSWTQPGQRTGDDPDISDVVFQKNADTYDRVTVFGSNRSITDETFTAQATFFDLNNDDIIPGSETVYNASDGTNFTRTDDYEMDYSDGQIRTVDGTSLTNGNTFTIDYRVEISGTHPSDVSSPNREFVDTVPGVVSDRGAEQIAFVLQTDNDTPIYSAELEIPRENVDFDPLDSLTLDAFDLPGEATPLETRGEPEISPTGIRLRLGTRSTIEESLSAIRETVSSISKQV